jgi:hypothetical protein
MAGSTDERDGDDRQKKEKKSRKPGSTTAPLPSHNFTILRSTHTVSG